MATTSYLLASPDRSRSSQIHGAHPSKVRGNARGPPAVTSLPRPTAAAARPRSDGPGGCYPSSSLTRSMRIFNGRVIAHNAAWVVAWDAARPCRLFGLAQVVRAGTTHRERGLGHVQHELRRVVRSSPIERGSTWGNVKTCDRSVGPSSERKAHSPPPRSGRGHAVRYHAHTQLRSTPRLQAHLALSSIPTKATFMLVNRGVAYLDGLVFRGTPDGRFLVALRSDSGRVLWNVKGRRSGGGRVHVQRPDCLGGTVFTGSPGVMGRPRPDDGLRCWRPGRRGGASGRSRWATSAGLRPGAFPRTAARAVAACGRRTPWTPCARAVRVGGNPAPDFLTSVRPGETCSPNSVVVLDAGPGR